MPHSEDEGNVQEVQFSSYKDHVHTLLLHTSPIAAGSLLTVMGTFGNALIIANLNDDAIAANAYISSTKDLLIYPVRSIFVALVPLIEKARAEENHLKISNYWKCSLLLSLEFSIIFCVILVKIDYFFKAISPNNKLSQNKEALEITKYYFYFFAAGLPSKLLLEVISELFIATNNQALLIPMNFLKTSLELGLNYFLICQLKMGENGWFISEFLQLFICSLIVLCYLAKSSRFTNYHLFSIRAPNRHEQPIPTICNGKKEILKLGLPIYFQSVAFTCVPFLETLILGAMGIDELVAFHICSQWSNWIAHLHKSLSTTACALTAKALVEKKGVNRADELKKIEVVAILTGIAISLVSLTVMSFAYKPMTQMLIHSGNTQTVESYTKVLLPLTGVNSLLFGLGSIATGVLCGHSETKLPMLMNIIGAMIGLCLSVKIRVHNNPPGGIMLGHIIGLALATTCILIFSRWKFKQSNVKCFEANPVAQCFSFFSPQVQYNRLQQSIELGELSPSSVDSSENILNAGGLTTP